MKKMLYILAAVVAIVALNSCKKEGGKPWNSDANVYINSQQSPKSVAMEASITPPPPATKVGEQQWLTPLEIIQQAGRLINTEVGLDIVEELKDFDKVRIVGASSWVVGRRGPEIYVTPDLISARNTVIVTVDAQFRTIDTIAYIPNSVMNAAEQKIRSAFAKEDYETCYKLFEEAFVFTPITGKEFRELKAKGEN